MLPEFLVGSYRQYKQDTKFVATWLAATARSTGYSSAAVPSQVNAETEATSSNGKKKTKAKAKPKTKKQKRDAARRIPRERRQYVITVQEFLPLSEHIKLNLKAPSRVPTSVITAISRVIEARSAANEWFANQNKNTDQDGHAHFIHTLTLVKQILEPLAGAEEDTTIQESADEVTLVDNMFEGLDIQDVSQQFLDSPGIPQKDHTAARALTGLMEYVFDHMGKKMEEQMAASALFRDIHKIYDHIRQTWLQYKEGKMELMAASLISNTGIDLIRRLEEDFFAQFPQWYHCDAAFLKQFKRFDPEHKDAQQLLNVMYRTKISNDDRCKESEDSNEDGTDEETEGSKSIFDPKNYETARYLFCDVLYMFIRYFHASQSMTKSVYQAPPGGPWDPDGNYDAMSIAHKVHADNEILAELLPDLAILSTSTSGIPTLAEDELLRGAREIAFDPAQKDKKRKFQPKAHLWWLVSLRLFCDIHHILGPSISKPFEHVHRLGQKFKDAFQEALQLRNSNKLELWPTTADADIKKNTIDRIHQSLFVDEVKEYINNAARNVRGWKGKADFQLLRRHPLVCGLMEFNVRQCGHDTGLIAIQATTSASTAAHLFNALKQESLCDADWHDLETFIELSGEKWIFGEGGTRPTTPEEYATRFHLTRGVSLKTFAADRRGRGIVSTNVMRFPEGAGNVFVENLLKLRHCPVDIHPEHTDKGCNEGLEFLEDALDKSYLVVSTEDQVLVRRRSLDAVEQRNEKRLHTSSKCTPVELLMSLQFGLSQVLPDIYFNYLAFHRTCWDLLKALSVDFPLLQEHMEQMDQGMPPKLAGTEQSRIVRTLAPVIFVLSMGLPFNKSKKMIRQCKMPHLPEASLSDEMRKLYDQRVLLAGMGAFIENRAANGRFRILANIHTRKVLAAKPQDMVFEKSSNKDGDSKVTVQGTKWTQHTNSRCTKEVCICGAKAMPMLKSNWKKGILDSDVGKSLLEQESEGNTNA